MVVAGARGVGLELLAVAAGLGAQALAGALALDAPPDRGPVGEPRHEGDDDDDDDDHDGSHGPRTYPRARPPERVASLRTVPPVTDLPLIASGKVREMYDLGDRILMVASDRISTYDVVHPDADPGQGGGAHGPVRLLVRAHRPHRQEPLRVGHRGRARGRPRARDDRVQAADAARRVRRARLHHRLGLEGLPGHRERLGHRAAARDCASPSACPTPVFTPSTKADEGHDEAIDFERSAQLVGDRELMARVRDVSIELYRFAAEHARERGVILADTKFEFGLDDDGELVVGDEVLTPDSSRYWPAEGYQAGPGAAELRQAVRARLGRRQRLGQDAAGAGAPRRRRAGHPRALRRGLRAHHRRAVRRVDEQDRRVRARVLIRPKAGILDPQGIAVERALPALGFSGVSNVHVGRLVELDVEDAAQLDDMCRRLLANPLIEDYEIVWPATRAREVRRHPLPRLVRRRRRAARRLARRRGRAAVARRP